MLINIEKGQLPISPSIAKGIKAPEAADLLEIKKSTCYGYVKDIYQKPDINSRSEATMEASKMGLID